MQRAQGQLVAPPLAAALATSSRAPHMWLCTQHFAEPAIGLPTSKFTSWIFVAYLPGGWK
jgi:hypothetical protein